MIRFIQGTLAGATETEVIVENHGIGYAIFVPASCLEQLPAFGEQIKLYTYFSVREDAMQLFGFLEPEDLNMYKLLIGVNGIGPKAGLAIMGTLSAYEIHMAILAEDAKAIAKAPGIGAKTAQKVILELKDKLDFEAMLEVAPQTTENQIRINTKKDLEIVKDAIEALVVLGYGKTEATKAVRSVEIMKDMTVDTLLKQSLKAL